MCHVMLVQKKQTKLRDQVARQLVFTIQRKQGHLQTSTTIYMYFNQNTENTYCESLSLEVYAQNKLQFIYVRGVLSASTKVVDCNSFTLYNSPQTRFDCPARKIISRASLTKPGSSTTRSLSRPT